MGNIAINIYMEDIEKRELRKLTPPNNKWKKNKSKKKKRKQKQNKKKKKNTDGQPLLPPIIFQRNRHRNAITKLSQIKMIVFDMSVLAYLHSFKAKKKMHKEN